jgi:hypothetical protein
VNALLNDNRSQCIWSYRRSKENVRQEVEREFRSECTFKPRTIETARREAIRMLLNDEASVASEPQRDRQAHPLY